MKKLKRFLKAQLVVLGLISLEAGVVAGGVAAIMFGGWMAWGVFLACSTALSCLVAWEWVR